MIIESSGRDYLQLFFCRHMEAQKWDKSPIRYDQVTSADGKTLWMKNLWMKWVMAGPSEKGRVRLLDHGAFECARLQPQIQEENIPLRLTPIPKKGSPVGSAHTKAPPESNYWFDTACLHSIVRLSRCSSRARKSEGCFQLYLLIPRSPKW